MVLFRRIAGTLIVVAVLFYLAGLAVTYFWQRQFQYDVTGTITDLKETTLANAAAVSIPTTNNETVSGWYAPPAPGKPVIVYYKGNAGSFS